jgi:hypothetical protein
VGSNPTPAASYPRAANEVKLDRVAADASAMRLPLFVASGIALGALATTGIVMAAASRTTDTSRTFLHFSQSMDAAGSKTLFEDGQFRIKGNCIDLGAGVFRAQAVIKTKGDNASFNSSNGDANDQDWDVADGTKKLQADGQAAQGSSAVHDFGAHADPSWFGVMRANGKEVLNGFVWSSAFHGPKCRWGGYLDKILES